VRLARDVVADAALQDVDGLAACVLVRRGPMPGGTVISMTVTSPPVSSLDARTS
jgi:hypothetical protein